jgi:DNA/RNA-binding domain of Phe-tRNA-synthetase-like protein
MLNISISEEIADKCPRLQVLAITCLVKNTNSDENLWKEIVEEERLIRDTVKLDQINKWLPIQATRQAYKCFGKDPNRYRPSAESLRRRILRELPLYKVDTLVDLINLVSIRSGYSIGGFDLDKIEGEQLVLGVGKEGELYHGIGRGELNITGLPVYRDKIGGIGTPTSDEERTKISLGTSRLLMIINGYSGNEGLMDAGKYAITLLSKYVSAKNVEIKRITVDGVADVVL